MQFEGVLTGDLRWEYTTRLDVFGVSSSSTQNELKTSLETFCTRYRNATFTLSAVYFGLTSWWWLTCGTQQSSHGRQRYGCQKGTVCLLPYTAHTQILWPDNATQKRAHTHTHTHTNKQNGTETQSLWEVTSSQLLKQRIKLSINEYCLIVYITILWYVWYMHNKHAY